MSEKHEVSEIAEEEFEDAIGIARASRKYRERADALTTIRTYLQQQTAAAEQRGELKGIREGWEAAIEAVDRPFVHMKRSVDEFLKQRQEGGAE